jgi:hypothetical protein
MRTSAWLLGAVMIWTTTGGGLLAQPGEKPGPEHEKIKKLEGTWIATVKGPGGESKGTMTYKSILGGFWMASEFKGDFGGMPFTGHGMDGYDPIKKQYVEYWFDSMGPGAMVFTGTFDKTGKVLTSTAEGPGPDGKPAKWKSVSTMKDDDTMEFTMSVGDSKEPMMTISYKRKK